MVTRTIVTTVALLACYNTETGAIEDKELEFTDKFKTTYALEKAANKALSGTALKLIHIKSSEVKFQRYGMSEEDFITKSEKLN